MKNDRLYSDFELRNDKIAISDRKANTDTHDQKDSIASTIHQHQEAVDEIIRRLRTNERVNLLGCGAAHDLSNLIGQILISISVLRSITPADDRKAQKLIAIIESSASKSAEVVKKLMNEAATMSSERQKVYIDQIVLDVERAVGCTFPKNIYVDTDVSESLWPIYGSSVDIYQAVTNLCLNARDAMPEGGNLSMSVKNVTLDEVDDQKSGNRKSDSRYVCLRIADTGVGISQEQLSNIFKPYYSKKQNGKGTGLGLFNVKHTVEGHEGFITVESLPGNGTIFYLYFPAIDSNHA